jgi:hypothetical protein
MANDAMKVRVTAICGAWLFLVGTALAIASVSSSHWTVSGDPEFGGFHIGPWRACGSIKGSDACVNIDANTPLLSEARYRRVQAVRGMMIVAVMLCAMGLLSGLAAILPRFPTNRIVAVPLVAGVVASILGIISTVMWSDLQAEGFGDVVVVRYGWGFDTAVAASILSFLAAVPYMVALPFAYSSVKPGTPHRSASFLDA